MNLFKHLHRHEKKADSPSRWRIVLAAKRDVPLNLFNLGRGKLAARVFALTTTSSLARIRLMFALLVCSGSALAQLGVPTATSFSTKPTTTFRSVISLGPPPGQEACRNLPNRPTDEHTSAIANLCAILRSNLLDTWNISGLKQHFNARLTDPYWRAFVTKVDLDMQQRSIEPRYIEVVENRIAFNGAAAWKVSGYYGTSTHKIACNQIDGSRSDKNCPFEKLWTGTNLSLNLSDKNQCYPLPAISYLFGAKTEFILVSGFVRPDPKFAKFEWPFDMIYGQDISFFQYNQKTNMSYSYRFSFYANLCVSRMAFYHYTEIDTELK